MNPQDPQNRNPYGPQPPYPQAGGVYSAPPAASGHNPYEFIINPATPKRPGFFSGPSFGKRIALVGGMLVILMIIISMVMSALGPKDVTTQFIKLDQQQEEIIRVASNAVEQAGNQDVKNFLTNTEASITSNQLQVNQYLVDHHHKVSPKLLALGKNADTDTLLANAAAANNYNQVALQIITTDLQSYATLLQSTYQQAPGSASKAILQKSYVAAQLLIAQAKAVTVQN